MLIIDPKLVREVLGEFGVKKLGFSMFNNKLKANFSLSIHHKKDDGKECH